MLLSPPILLRPHRQRGASLIEALLFLLIVALIAIGVFAIYSNASASTKVQNENRYIQALTAAVKQMYASNPNYGTSDITATLVSTNRAPAPMIAGGTLKNSWGGAVTVTGATTGFTISYAAVPMKECIQLSQIRLNPTAISINGTAQALPLTTAAATTACSTASNAIIWTIN